MKRRARGPIELRKTAREQLGRLPKNKGGEGDGDDGLCERLAGD